MSDGAQASADEGRNAKLADAYQWRRLAEFLTMDDADHKDQIARLLEADSGATVFDVFDHLGELERRATNRHTQAVEAYAKRLDRLTVLLTRLTFVLVLMTAVLIALAIDERSPGTALVAFLVVLALTLVITLTTNPAAEDQSVEDLRRWWRRMTGSG